MTTEIEIVVPSLARSDVFILGAGFSKAINKNMLLANELLKPVLDKLGDQVEPPRGGEGFEQWLSRLAAPQPYLTADQNLERSAAFMKVSRAIAEVLMQREQEALTSTILEWFAKLLFAWHVRKATIISFNYDNLVECGINSQHLPDTGGYPIGVHDALLNLPPIPFTMQEPEASPSTFRLIKLHGSISWYWMSDDMTGATLQRWPDVGSFGSRVGDQREVIRRHLPGRVPFIAPPSSTKSRYLSNPVIRQLWADAYKALCDAKRIFILGYSLPLQDQAAMGLIVEGIGDRMPEIRVVNRDGDAVIGNLAGLLVPKQYHNGEAPDIDDAHRVSELKSRYRVNAVSGDASIIEAADSYLDELAENCAANLTSYSRSVAKIEAIIDAHCRNDQFKLIPVVGSVNALAGGTRYVLLYDQMTVDEDGTLAIPFRFHKTSDDDDDLALTKLVSCLQSDAGVRKIVLREPSDDASPEVRSVIPIVAYQLDSNTQPALHPNWNRLLLIPFKAQPQYRPPDNRAMFRSN
ncbi:hypothetical protein [Ferrimicrobium acidiphilum]|uniref:hypothetical protein n=1 Tax=Ferrimicrobium acidiphilum TaxID=121039 RepID=UPI0023F249EF|nr:hypothetical protein [Ferrimicrobium acidiphilum]